MLEKMAEFFDARLDGYDAHMLANILGAEDFYPFTAQCLPAVPGAEVLDLGCGTGLELEYYYALNPHAKITGIDLAPGMLARMQEKFADRKQELILGSYFDVPFGVDRFDAAVSVESLHHFTGEKKLSLYRKLHMALKSGGYFILTDYFAADDREEQSLRQAYLTQKQKEGLTDGDFYHFDTPLTVNHEMRILTDAGFSTVELLNSWGATHALLARK